MLRWWKSAVNLSFFLSLAILRMCSSACDTLTRLCVRHVLCWLAFPLVPALGSTGSAADCSALFAGSSASRCGPPHPAPTDIDGGQPRDIPGSDAILLRVMWPLTPAGQQCLA